MIKTLGTKRSQLCGRVVPRSLAGSNLDLEIRIYCLFAMHADLRSKSKDWLAGSKKKKNKCVQI